MNDRLYRSRSDRVIGGVCGGLATRLDLDPSIVRIGWVLLTILTGGAFLVVYVIMLIVVPEEPVGWVPPFAPGPSAPGPSPAAYPGWVPPTTAGPSMSAAGTPAAGSPGGAADAADPSGAAETANPSGAAETAGAPSAGGAAGAAWTPPGATPPGGPTDPGAAPSSGWSGPAGTPPTGGTPPPAGTPPTGGSTPWVAPAQGYADRAAERRAGRAGRDHTSALIVGALLILLGAYFLVRESLPTVDIDRAWPVAVIVVGVLFLVLSFRRGSGPA